MKFDKKTTLSEVLGETKGAEILAKYNVPCLSCPFAKVEMEKLTLEEICEGYKINLENLLKELNNQIKK